MLVPPKAAGNYVDEWARARGLAWADLDDWQTLDVATLQTAQVRERLRIRCLV